MLTSTLSFHLYLRIPNSSRLDVAGNTTSTYRAMQANGTTLSGGAAPCSAVPAQLATILSVFAASALSAAEPTRLQADQIARSLMCHHSGGMVKYHLNEIPLSWHIRRRFSEREILTIYANRAYFGVGVVGIEKSLQEFFQKEPRALRMEQAALIAGLLLGPDLQVS
jgi:hypothetical protein